MINPNLKTTRVGYAYNAGKAVWLTVATAGGKQPTFRTARTQRTVRPHRWSNWLILRVGYAYNPGKAVWLTRAHGLPYLCSYSPNGLPCLLTLTAHLLCSVIHRVQGHAQPSEDQPLCSGCHKHEIESSTMVGHTGVAPSNGSRHTWRAYEQGPASPVTPRP